MVRCVDPGAAQARGNEVAATLTRCDTATAGPVSVACGAACSVGMPTGGLTPAE